MVAVVVLSISRFSASTCLVVLRDAPLCVCACRVAVAPELVWSTVRVPLARCPCAEVVLPEWDTDPRLRCASSVGFEPMTRAIRVTEVVR